MAESATRGPTQIERFLAHLGTQTGDRGVMADLRHGLSRATEYRAWPHVAPWCKLDNERDRRIWLIVAAGFAIHQRSAQTGNMGTVLRSLATSGGRGAEGLSTFDARFRRFLSCASSAEACDHLGGVLRAAERSGVMVNFSQLYLDLIYWGERVKVRWATEYWGAPSGDDEEIAVKESAPPSEGDEEEG